MATSLMSMLAQKTPSFQTRKGIIVLGLQNDFIANDGVLPVSTESGFLDNIRRFVPAFREFGEVIWVRTEYNEHGSALEVDREEVITSLGSKRRSSATDPKRSKRRCNAQPAQPQGPEDSTHQNGKTGTTLQDSDSEDEELFLARTSKRGPACIKGSKGADYAVEIQDLVSSRDIEVIKPRYSAFGSTSLLSTLRSRLITELYVCGCNTNLSVYASAMDAARSGIAITILDDCLGFRKKERHDLAIKRLVEIMDANVTTSTKALRDLETPSFGADDDDSSSDEDDDAGSIHLSVDSDEEDDEMPLPSSLSNVCSYRTDIAVLSDCTSH
ncbi:Isochorismatase hydrolase [Polychaeton citri CBS 116435]|uniref:Isochorismatase hydrolase n=1 Tax=Polychaeton citri CBS 116435 TaxID=1314669 RepID=A0A9P4QIK8_9PEZI|nr:Isochorismatase hydrolase [Polychaeton citri CBS 116435]